jgi:hypothetical protein
MPRENKLTYQEAKQYLTETMPVEARKIAIERVYLLTGGNRWLTIKHIEQIKVNVLESFDQATKLKYY